LISELLPDSGGRRFSNSDPVTGKAAWFDLRVRVRKCATGEIGLWPRFAPAKQRPDAADRPTLLRYSTR